MELSEQEILRRQSLEELRKLGIDPYPAEVFDVNVTAQEIHENFPKDNKCNQVHYFLSLIKIEGEVSATIAFPCVSIFSIFRQPYLSVIIITGSPSIFCNSFIR